VFRLIKSQKYFAYILLIAIISCKAQSQLAPINGTFNNASAGTYFSDIDIINLPELGNTPSAMKV